MELGSGSSQVGVDLDELDLERKDRIQSPMATVDLDREASHWWPKWIMAEKLSSPPWPTSWPPPWPLISSSRREAWSSRCWRWEGMQLCFGGEKKNIRIRWGEWYGVDWSLLKRMERETQKIKQMESMLHATLLFG